MRKPLVIAAVLLSSIAAGAQAPNFRTETTVVQIPVRVVDGKGNFVRTLTAADFQVFEDGVPQTISAFSLVDLTATSSQTASRTPSTGVLSPADLENLEGRLYVFLLDDAHTSMMHSARARDLISGFIKNQMLPTDAGAVLIASGAARQDFTRDKQALLKAVDRFTGTLDAGEPAGVQETRARAMVKLVTDLAGALGQIRGKHKTVIYVGSRVGCQVSYEATQDFAPKIIGDREPQPLSGDRVGNLSSSGTGAADNAGDQVLCNEQLLDAVRAAVHANVSLYSIDPRGMLNRGWVSPSVDGRGGPDMARRRMAVTEPGRPSVLDGFYVLSDQTGGFAVTDTNNFRDPFARIVRETGTYYMLSYASTNSSQDGKYRRTEIKVNQTGVQVFYRAGYLARR
jgi:VWFA-related protein